MTNWSKWVGQLIKIWSKIYYWIPFHYQIGYKLPIDSQKVTNSSFYLIKISNSWSKRSLPWQSRGQQTIPEAATLRKGQGLFLGPPIGGSDGLIPQHQAKKPRTYPYDAPFCPGSMEVCHGVQWSLVIFTVVYVHDICINKFIIYLAFFFNLCNPRSPQICFRIQYYFCCCCPGEKIRPNYYTGTLLYFHIYYICTIRHIIPIYPLGKRY